MTGPSTNERIAALIDAGNLDEAKALVDDLLRFSPDDVNALNSLGRILLSRGQPWEALGTLEHAVAAAQKNADVLCNYAQALHATGQLNSARYMFIKSLSANRDNPRTRGAFGATLLAMGHTADAVTMLDGAARERRDHFETQYNLALALHEVRQLATAADQYRLALELKPGDPATLSNLGAVLTAEHDLDGARGAFHDALATDAQWVPALAGLAGLAELEGRDEEALSWLERALATGKADAGLAIARARMLKRHKRLDEARAVLAPLAGNDALAVSERAMIEYTLGDIDDAAERYDEAFRHYVAANEARPGECDPAAHGARLDRIVSVFTRERLEALTPTGAGQRRPVFIVGMPRSGTSLVEQILASHSQVHGGGELRRLSIAGACLLRGTTLYPEAVTDSDRTDLDRAANHYLDALSDLDADSRHVTDKTWGNFKHIGLIQVLFGTGARVVHCSRSPLDTLVSCYFKSFGTRGLAFTNRFDWLARYYRQYRQLMDYWRNVSDLGLFEMRYERLVSDQEGETRKLIEWLGLDFEPRCLEFHRTRRTVLTASQAQVREPMNDRSVGRHKHYLKFLASLRLQLGPLINEGDTQ